MSRSVYGGASVVYIHFLVLRMEDSIVLFWVVVVAAVVAVVGV